MVRISHVAARKVICVNCVLAFFTVFCLTGCSNSSEEPEEVVSQSNIASPQLEQASGSAEQSQQTVASTSPSTQQPKMLDDSEFHSSDTTKPYTPFRLEEPGESDRVDLKSFAAGSTEAPRRQLRADLSPAELREFLSGADKDMQLIASGRAGISNQKEALAEMQRIAKLKLEAARRLRVHADASPEAKSEGARGELQALSHAAALGDLKSAKELEQLAEGNLESADPTLVSDSRLVLIGFAIEKLQNGNQQATSEIARHVKELASGSSNPGIPAMMVMGQARQVLAQYGHQAEAKQVRDTIIDLFAGASDPQVAKMAAQLAGNVQYDQIDQLLRQAISGQWIESTAWTKAVNALVDESSDLQTVQYLAGAALQFEGLGKEVLADSTYRILDQRFPDAESATRREVQLALDARRARREAIGSKFEPDLPSVDSESLSLDTYQGKVVLMPFWAMGFPESLQLVPQLQELAKADDKRIAIVGVNLDPKGAPVLQFVEQKELSFPSFRAESNPDDQIPNPTAAAFGMVSMPFLVVIDQQGNVASIDYTMAQIKMTLSSLLGNE